MFSSARQLETLQWSKKGGPNYTFFPILMKNRGRNTTFSSFLLKHRGRNYTNFPETWKTGSKWRSICSNLHIVSTPRGYVYVWMYNMKKVIHQKIQCNVSPTELKLWLKKNVHKMPIERHPIAGLNPLRPIDTIWRHRAGSTSAQAMAHCLTAQSHYLKQCWLITYKVLWH